MNTPKRFLIIDNTANMRLMYRKVLEKNGVKIDATDSADEALKMVSANDYDLALIDNGIQPMGGLDFLTRLKIVAPELPAIMITGFPSDYIKRKSAELGAVDYLVKPIELKNLKIAVSNALNAGSPVII
ncbi:response regulator [bacterium]|nr:response regulator [bacterium]